MEPDISTRETTALLNAVHHIPAFEEHTGGNCWVTQVDLADGTYVWISDMDGPFIAGHYADGYAQDVITWIGQLDPEGDDPIYSAEAAAAIVARYVDGRLCDCAYAPDGDHEAGCPVIGNRATS